MIRILTLTLALLIGTQASAQRLAGPTPINPDKSVVMVIDTAISNASMSGLLSNMRDIIAAKKYKGPRVVDLVLNSPGGSVVTGFEFLSLMSAMQDSGWKFRCTVYHIAASMAFQILNQCDERRALSNAFVLWHRARVYVGGIFGQAMTAPLARTLADDLQSVDEVIYSQLLEGLGQAGAGEEYISKHFEAETLHVASVLHANVPEYISVYSSVPGLVDALLDEKVLRTQNQRSFFDSIRFGELIYIRDSVRATQLGK